MTKKKAPQPPSANGFEPEPPDVAETVDVQTGEELAPQGRLTDLQDKLRALLDYDQIGEIRLDPASRTLTKAGEPVELAAKEFDLLELLMSHPGQVMRREQIMDEVWDPHWFGPTKTLDVHISWLRKKIEDDPSDPRYITTIRGVGFRFLAPDEA